MTRQGRGVIIIFVQYEEAPIELATRRFVAVLNEQLIASTLRASLPNGGTSVEIKNPRFNLVTGDETPAD